MADEPVIPPVTGGTAANPSPASDRATNGAGGGADNQLGNLNSANANVLQAGHVVYNNNKNTRFVLSFGNPGKIKSVGGKGRGWSVPGSSVNDLKLNKYGQALHADPSSGIAAEEAKGPATEQVPKKLPETLDEVHTWYRDLNPIAKCFVQAMAVLSGAPEHEIRRATDELYRPVREAEERRERIRMRGNKKGDEEFEDLYEPPVTPSIALDTQFLANTHTEVRKLERARRLFWTDTQANGHSPFSVLVLVVIWREEPLGGHEGQVGQRLLERLEELPEKLGGESFWRVPRALGSLWLEADETRLRLIADAWVRDVDSNDVWGWRVAHLLEGAFAAEHEQLGQKVYQRGQSIVLSLLNEWTDEVHNSATDTVRIRLGCAVAMTYRQFDIQHFRIALNGIDELLRFPTPEDEEEDLIPENILIAAVSAYTILANQGCAREVLGNLAESAERFAHQRQDIKLRNGRKDIQAYLVQRLIILIAKLNTFVLLAGSSLGPLQEDRQVSYVPPLTLVERTEIPDERNIDILLTGIIASGETTWRENVKAILSAFFVEDNVALAFDILREWAEEVLKIQGPGALRVRRAYLDFVVAVLRQSEQWCGDLKRAGYDTYSIRLSTLTIIRRWQAESLQPPQPLGAFAEDILRQLQVW